MRNINRSIGARLSGEIARAHGAAGLPDNCLTLKLHRFAPARASACGTPAACNLLLEGDANDYVGKGMAGGRIVIQPPHGLRLSSRTTP